MMMTKVNIGVSFNKLSECYPLSQQWESLFTDANISRKSIMIGLSYPKRVSASFSLLTASPGTFSLPWSRCISIPLTVFRYVLVVVNQCLNHLRPFLIIKCFFLHTTHCSVNFTLSVFLGFCDRPLFKHGDIWLANFEKSQKFVCKNKLILATNQFQIKQIYILGTNSKKYNWIWIKESSLSRLKGKTLLF